MTTFQTFSIMLNAPHVSTFRQTYMHTYIYTHMICQISWEPLYMFAHCLCAHCVLHTYVHIEPILGHQLNSFLALL